MSDVARPTPQQNGNVDASPRRCGPRTPNTADRLFGSAEAPKRAIKVNDTFKSSIFDSAKPSPPSTPKKKAVPVLERNPITGEVKVPAKVQV